MVYAPPTTNFHSPTLITVPPTLYFQESKNKTATAREIIIKHLCDIVNNSKVDDMMLFYFCGYANRRIENTNCNDTDYEEFMVLLN